MDCDLCGKTGEMLRAIIEGSKMTVCSSCAKYGTVTGKAGTFVPEKKAVQPRREEVAEAVVDNLGDLLKKKREQLGLSQKDFARKIAEKESALHKMETGTLVPTMDRARKIGRILGLNLIEEIKDAQVTSKKDNFVMTLGDFVKIKQRKK